MFCGSEYHAKESSGGNVNFHSDVNEFEFSVHSLKSLQSESSFFLFVLKIKMESLKTACAKTTFKSFKDLAVGEYLINRFLFVDTHFGKRIRINLDGFYMYLPERFATLTESELNDLNSSQKIMIYSGKDANNQNRLLLDFQETDAYFADLLTPYNSSK